MKEIKLLAPVSIDGYISRINGDTDWIHFEGDDFCKYYNLEFFFDTIDYVVMNRMQYMTLQFQSFTWPIRDKPYYIPAGKGEPVMRHSNMVHRYAELPATDLPIHRRGKIPCPFDALSYRLVKLQRPLK